MKLLKIYLDTSVINFLFADDAPEKKEITEEFFDKFVSANKYDVYISNVVIAELEETTDLEERKRLIKVVKKYGLKFVNIQVSDEITSLAQLYIENKVIPQKKLIDAYHVAISVINEMDILLSWNFRHLANINRETKINLVNLANNYTHSLRVVSPLEVLDYDKW